MRVLFTTAAWHTHFMPMVPLAWAFRSLGHEVRVAAQPGVAGTVTGAGLPVVPIGPDMDFAELHRQSLSPSTPNGYRAHDSTIELFHRVAEAMVDDLIVFTRAWKPDLIIRDPVAFAASVAAEAIGVPLMRHNWGPDLFGTDQGRWLVQGVLERLRPHYERYGALPPDRPEWTVIDPTPDSLRLETPERRLPVRYVPYNGAGTVPSWVLERPERPRVCLTWGTIASAANGLSGTFHVPQVIEALAGLELELVVAVTPAERDALGVLGAHVRVVHGLPLHTLLPSCSAVVHHGGVATMLTAAGLGVPQLTLAQRFEYLVNAERLAATGAGTQIPGDRADVSAIRNAVGDLLFTAPPRAAARKLRDEVEAMPSPVSVVAQIEDLLLGSR